MIFVAWAALVGSRAPARRSPALLRRVCFVVALWFFDAAILLLLRKKEKIQKEMFPVSTILKCGMLIILINSSIHLVFGIFAGLPHGKLAAALRTNFFRHVVPRSLQNMKKGNVLSFKVGGACERSLGVP